MEILKFDNAATPRRKKNNNLKSLAGLATVAAIAVLGSTLAANLSLNSGGAIEFGQGVSITSACDSDGITVTPSVRFVNEPGGGTFYLSTIALSDIDAATTSTCLNKTFSLNAYNNSDATPLQLATHSSTPITNATFSIKTGNTAVGSEGVTFTDVTSDSTAGAITLGFGEPSSTSGAVYKITLQSQ